MTRWLMLVASLPGSTKTPRMRVWRALRAGGAAALRDGVYVLPESDTARNTFEAQVAEVAAAGGSAQVLPLTELSAAQERSFRALFDRSAEYSRLLSSLEKFQRELRRAREGDARRRLAALRREGALLRAVDFFSNAARGQVEQALSDAERAINAVFSPDEPRPARSEVQRLSSADYQARLWATRRNLWIDRVCSAWLIRRFIDRKAKFVWLADPAKCPPRALGFDFDGATFTHLDGRVTFEVLLASFRLEQDPRLMKLGALVHYLDVGGAPIAEAAGLETIMAGLRSNRTEDDEILRVMTSVLDGLYAGYAPTPKATPSVKVAARNRPSPPRRKK